jgi:di/tricarboxylate transporter
MAGKCKKTAWVVVACIVVAAITTPFVISKVRENRQRNMYRQAVIEALRETSKIIQDAQDKYPI